MVKSRVCSFFRTASCRKVFQLIALSALRRWAATATAARTPEYEYINMEADLETYKAMPNGTVERVTEKIGTARSCKGCIYVGFGESNTGRRVTEWASTGLAGKAFGVRPYRNDPQNFVIYATETAEVSASTVTGPARIVQHQFSLQRGHFTRISGNYMNQLVEIESSGNILVSLESTDADYLNLVPAAQTIFGTCSTKCTIVVFNATNQHILQECSDGSKKTLSGNYVYTVPTTGNLYTGIACKWTAPEGVRISGHSWADSNGGDGTVFLPPAYFQLVTPVPLDMDWVKFISDQQATCHHGQTSFTLQGQNGVFHKRLGSVSAGTVINCTHPVQAFGDEKVHDDEFQLIAARAPDLSLHYAKLGNSCLLADGTDSEHAIGYRETHLEACKSRCTVHSGCTAIEWYESGLNGKECFLHLGAVARGSSGPATGMQDGCYAKSSYTGFDNYCALANGTDAANFRGHNLPSGGLALHIDASLHDSPTDTSGKQVPFSGSYPTEKRATLNGHPAWDMSNHCFTTPEVQLNRDATIFIVSTVTRSIQTWGSQFWHGEHDQDFGLEQMSNSRNMNLQSYNDNSGALIEYTYDEPTVWSGRTNSVARTFWKTRWVNGQGDKKTHTARGNSGGRPAPGMKTIAIGGNNKGCGEKFNGILGELIYYNRALSDAEMSSVTDHLFAKWSAEAKQAGNMSQLALEWCKSGCSANHQCTAIEWYATGWNGFSQCFIVQNAVARGSTNSRLEDVQCYVKQKTTTTTTKAYLDNYGYVNMEADLQSYVAWPSGDVVQHQHNIGTLRSCKGCIWVGFGESNSGKRVTEWASTGLAGREFVLSVYRYDLQFFVIYAVEEAHVRMTAGSVVNLHYLKKGEIKKISGSYVGSLVQFESSGDILVSKDGTGGDYVNLVPAAQTLFGTCSTVCYLVVFNATDATITQECSDGSKKTYSGSNTYQIPDGGSQYTGIACKFTAPAGVRISGHSWADADGGDGVSFLPPASFQRVTPIPLDMEFVKLISDQQATCSANSEGAFMLQGANGVYTHRLTNIASGTVIKCSSGVQAFGDEKETDDEFQLIAPDACLPGIWYLKLQATHHCDMERCSGGNDLTLNISGHTRCEAFQIRKIPSCSPQDTKCELYNCASDGVLMLADSIGNKVDAGTPDSMLGCGNNDFRILNASFQGPTDCICTNQVVTRGLVLDFQVAARGINTTKWENQVQGGPDAYVPHGVSYNEVENAFHLPGGIDGGEVISVPLATNPSIIKAVTYSAWVKPLDFKGTNGWILAQAPDYSWSRAVTLSDSRLGGTGVTPGGYNSGLGNMPLGEWSHVVGVWSSQGGPCSIFLNNTKWTGTCTNGNDPVGNTEVFLIGGRGHNDASHNAEVLISDVAVFNVSLTDSEVQMLYNRGRSSLSQATGTSMTTSTTTAEAGTLLLAYWDHGSCGSKGNDHNWGWCDQTNFNCSEAVPTSECESGFATLWSTQGDGTCCASVNIAGCDYAYYAQYRCAEPEEEVAMCNGCSNRPMECWAACGSPGYCSACNSAQGAFGACCRADNGVHESSDPAECLSVDATLFDYSGYHMCVLTNQREVVTRLRSGAAQGLTQLPVADTTGLYPGVQLTLSDDESNNVERKTVIDVSNSRRLFGKGRRLAAGTVTLDSPLEFTWGAGAQIKATASQALSISSGFAATSGIYYISGEHQNGRMIWKGPGSSTLHYERVGSTDGINSGTTWMGADAWTIMEGGVHRYGLVTTVGAQYLCGSSGWRSKASEALPVTITGCQAYHLNPGAACIPGYVPIATNWADCKSAAESLGYMGDATAHTAFEIRSANYPPGCYRSGMHGKILFNKGAGGAVDNDSILCKLNEATTHIKASDRATYVHADGGTTHGNDLTMAYCKGRPNCQFEIIASTTRAGMYYLKASDQDTYIHARGGTRAGNEVTMHSCGVPSADHGNCQWEFIASTTRPGMYYIKASDRDTYLHARGGSQAGHALTMHACGGRSTDYPNCQFQMPNFNQPVPVFELMTANKFDGGSNCVGNAEGRFANLPSTGPYTIELEVKPSSDVNSGGIVGWGDWRQDSKCNAFRFDRGPKRLINYWWKNDFTVDLPKSLADGDFHHVAVTYDGTNRVLFVDNVQVGSTPVSGEINASKKSTFCIGQTNTKENFKGEIRKLRIWNVAKTFATTTMPGPAPVAGISPEAAEGGMSTFVIILIILPVLLAIAGALFCVYRRRLLARRRAVAVMPIAGPAPAVAVAAAAAPAAAPAKPAAAKDEPKKTESRKVQVLDEEKVPTNTVKKGSVPQYWTSNNEAATDAFDQMVYVSREAFDEFNELFAKTYRPISTQDRPCPKAVQCKKTPGGCACVKPGGTPGLPTGFIVRRVIRVEEADMWARYVNKRDAIKAKRGEDCGRPLDPPIFTKEVAAKHEDIFSRLDDKLNEVYLWHGTHVRVALQIAQNDFNIELAGSGAGTMYGKGTYMAESCTKADEYAKHEDGGYYDGVYAMVLCRVCLGKYFYTTQRDEEAQKKVTSGEFDSTCGDRAKSVNTYRELVVYDKDQIYPEFVVLYSRLHQKDDEAKMRELAKNELFHMQLPVYWNNCHVDPVKTGFRVHYNVKKHTRELIQRLVKGATSKDPPTVTRVRRVEDSVMWTKYVDFRAQVVARKDKPVPIHELDGDASGGHCITQALLDDADLQEQAISVENLDARANELLLWHGTSKEAAEAIAEDGFQISHDKAKHGKRFGEGAYLAEDLNKSLSYAPATDGIQYVLLCRTICGDMHYTEAGSETLAHLHARNSSKDSVLANPRKAGPREFIVLKEEQVYPEFILEVKR